VLTIQKLVRNGNSTQLTILRQVLNHLGWRAGEAVAVEVLEDGSLHVYRPNLRQPICPQMRPVVELAPVEPVP
jgi:antitoxin component of MazEF toxin-antitoxin module